MATKGNWSKAMDGKLEELRRDPESYYKRARGKYVPESTSLTSGKYQPTRSTTQRGERER